MSGMYGYSRDAVRIKVKKCEGMSQPEFRKFSVDPQITTFEVLQSILTKAFDIKTDFTISYRLYDMYGNETYVPLLSDWELDAAFLKAHNLSLASSSEPSLCLRVDTKPLEEVSNDWEVRGNVPVITQLRTSNAQEVKPAPRLHGIINQVGKTLNMVQRVLNFGDDPNASAQPPRPPLSDSEFRKFLDPIGQIVHSRELRSVIYFGGIDPSLRKVVWKYILNVYPSGMCGKERMDYIKNKASEYVELRETWKAAMSNGPVVGELAYTTGMVKKDVLRTDRHHQFYAGSDDNRNIESLYNILTTYALNHPKVSYCQGMSDLASPLLVTMVDEAHAYICFCALMARLCTNFMLDGIAMTQKFTHLAEGLLFYDPEFYNYLKSHQADDLLFCYRWLLLEMKREFAFEDSLRMLEVLWSSIPADPPDKELRLHDVKFQPQLSPPPPPLKTPRENAYTKVCALRRQSSSISLVNYSGAKKSATVKRQNHSLDETIGRYKNAIVETKMKHQSLDDATLTQRPRSISPSETKSDPIVLSNRSSNNRKSSSMTSLIRNSKKSGHFKDLKERIVSSLDRLDSTTHSILEESEDSAPKGKVVKNLNEFLHFASVNKSKISDKLIRFNSVSEDKPKILLTRSSLDDSESSGGRRHSSTSDETFDDYSPDDSQEYFPLTTSATRELKLEFESLDRRVKTTTPETPKSAKPGHVERLSTKDSVFVWENPLHRSNTNLTKPAIPNHIQTPDEQAELEYDSNETSNSSSTQKVNDLSESEKDINDLCEEVSEVLKVPTMLPAPDDFGGGNPFLMFLCITVLLQHRGQIIDSGMDYNEMAMHFDKMVRKHNVNKVLNQARQMYAGYLKQHKMAQQKVTT